MPDRLLLSEQLYESFPRAPSKGAFLFQFSAAARSRSTAELDQG